MTRVLQRSVLPMCVCVLVVGYHAGANEFAILMDKASTQAKVGRFQESLTTLRKAQALAPENPTPHFYMAQVALRLPDDVLASRHFRKYLLLHVISDAPVDQRTRKQGEYVVKKLQKLDPLGYQLYGLTRTFLGHVGRLQNTAKQQAAAEIAQETEMLLDIMRDQVLTTAEGEQQEKPKASVQTETAPPIEQHDATADALEPVEEPEPVPAPKPAPQPVAPTPARKPHAASKLLTTLSDSLLKQKIADGCKRLLHPLSKLTDDEDAALEKSLIAWIHEYERRKGHVAAVDLMITCGAAWRDVVYGNVHFRVQAW